MLQQVIIFRINMHIHIHFLLSPCSPAPTLHKTGLIFSRSFQQLHSGKEMNSKVPLNNKGRTLDVHREVILGGSTSGLMGLGAAGLHVSVLT